MSYSIRFQIRTFIASTALVVLLLGAAMQPVFAAGDYVVSTIDDTDDGTCDADCSLREAITASNADGIASAITFSAGANGTIKLGSALPDLANNGALTITGNGAANTIISGNNAVRVFSVVTGANVTISSLTVTLGVGDLGGGLLNAGTLTVTNSIVSGNTVTLSGGGLFNLDGRLTVSNSTVSGNSAASNGGGLSNFFGSTLTVSNSTVSGNWAKDGGGLLNRGALTLNNSIVANSTSGGDCVSTGGAINAQNSLIEDGLGCVNGTNTANLTGDPALNGDLTLLNTSIAINAGDNSLIPVGVTTDLAGNARIAETTVDMGAYESVSTPLTFTMTGSH